MRVKKLYFQIIVLSILLTNSLFGQYGQDIEFGQISKKEKEESYKRKLLKVKRITQLFFEDSIAYDLGNYKSKNIYEYNEFGNVFKNYSLHPKGDSMFLRAECEYDIMQRRTKIKRYYVNGEKATYSAEFENDILIRETILNVKENIHIREYDSQGNKVYQCTYDKRGNLIDSYFLDYNNQGKIISSKSYILEDLSTKTRYKYLSDSEVLMKRNSLIPKYKKKTITKFDNNNRIQEVFTNDKRESKSWVVYNYDLAGNKIRQEYFKESKRQFSGKREFIYLNKELINEISYDKDENIRNYKTYIYDSNGMLILIKLKGSNPENSNFSAYQSIIEYEE